LADAVIIGVDSAAKAGWSILCQSHLVRFGVLNTWRGRDIESVIATAIDLARRERLPLHLAMEHWPAPFAGRSMRTWLGLGEARGVWKREFLCAVDEERGRENPTCRIGKGRVLKLTGRHHLADVMKWRKALYGSARAPKDTAKDKAVAWVREEYGQLVEPHDAAEAVCVGTYVDRVILG
jgi:hypothetical protein